MWLIFQLPHFNYRRYYLIYPMNFAVKAAAKVIMLCSVPNVFSSVFRTLF
jgi:hypothetical protein